MGVPGNLCSRRLVGSHRLLLTQGVMLKSVERIGYGTKFGVGVFESHTIRIWGAGDALTNGGSKCTLHLE
eukprot:1159752-Pelagomonas_calceolata.AAC.1